MKNKCIILILFTVIVFIASCVGIGKYLYKTSKFQITGPLYGDNQRNVYIRVLAVPSDKNYLYYLVPNLKGKNIKNLGGGYYENNGLVFFYDNNHAIFLPDYAVDVNNGNGFTLVEDVDIESFQIIKNNFARDKSHIFFKNNRMKVDYHSFNVIDGSYSKDNNNIYYGLDNIPGADLDSFQILNDPTYSKDSKQVFHFSNKIENADPESFELLENYYAKDKNSLFYDGKELKGAIPKSFKFLNFPYGIDGDVIYYKNYIINLELTNVNLDIDHSNYRRFKINGELYEIDEFDDYIQINRAGLFHSNSK